MSEVADALKLKTPDLSADGAARGQPAGKPATAQDAASRTGKPGAERKATRKEGPEPHVVDPLQWWGALTQQFQQIAASAMENAAATSTAISAAAGAAQPTPAAAGTSRKTSARVKAPRRQTTAR